jgi:hypothetical protein
MTALFILILICGAIIILQSTYNFDLDETSDREILIWYNHKQSRKYVKIWPLR